MAKPKRTKRETPTAKPQPDVPMKENKITPYDTGKVKIGCAYVPPQRPISEDEHVWQDVFMHNAERTNPIKSALLWTLCGIGLVFYIFLLIGV